MAFITYWRVFIIFIFTKILVIIGPVGFKHEFLCTNFWNAYRRTNAIFLTNEYPFMFSLAPGTIL